VKGGAAGRDTGVPAFGDQPSRAWKGILQQKGAGSEREPARYSYRRGEASSARTCSDWSGSLPSERIHSRASSEASALQSRE